MKKTIIADSTIDSINIKDFLESYSSLSSRKIKQLLKDKKIQLNGKKAYYDNKIKAGDRVELDLSETGKDSTAPEDIPIEVIYEDEHFLAVNKPAGMLVHPTQNHTGGTLSNGVKHYLINNGVDIPIRFVNRIDMDTSGIVIIAKSGSAHSDLAGQLNMDSSEKLYLALAEGNIEQKSGVIDRPIGIDNSNPIRRAVMVDGQNSITEYEILEQYEDAAFLRLKLITGRTHQIRVHLSSMGHPLLGDRLYGGSMEKIQRQALHAYMLRFMHPYKNKLVTIQAELPQDMKLLIDKLKG